jgi:hypothetical protein
MDQPCELYFFVKTAFKKPDPVMHPMKTVIYNVAKVQSTDAKAAGAQLLKIGVTQALRTEGIMAWLFGVEVTYHLVRGATRDQAMELLDDPTFTFKNDAITISLHAVTVDLSTEASDKLFCEARA